jgi:EipB-like
MRYSIDAVLPPCFEISWRVPSWGKWMAPSTLRLIGTTFGVVLFLASAFAAEAGGMALAAHRAVYDLVLDRSEPTTELADLNGRIVMEFTGSHCSGYTVALRFVTEIADPEGDRRVTDARTTTFEQADGAGFKFDNETFVDDALTEESRGSAHRADNGVDVTLTKPGDKKFVLDRAVAFPTGQIEQIIEAAQRGDRFLQIDVYDGSEDGETVYSTAVVIGEDSVASHDVGDETATKDAGVADLRHWPVTVSYFDQETGGEQMPVYVMSFVLYENGVSRHLKIDYGDFAIVGRLAQLEMLPLVPCPDPGKTN